MNKLKYSIVLLLFCFLTRAQTDTARVNPPKPADQSQADDQVTPAPTPTTTPQQPQEGKRKRPKGYDDYVNKGKRPDQNSTPFSDDIYYGCNLQLGFYGVTGGSVLYYDISPHVGYKFNEFLSAGFQVIYNNQAITYGTQHLNYSIFGVGVFARALVLDRFFLQVEVDELSIPGSYRNNSGRLYSDEKMAGIGYKSPLGDKLSYYFVLLYDFSPGTNSPYLYSPLVYRAGLSWNF